MDIVEVCLCVKSLFQVFTCRVPRNSYVNFFFRNIIGTALPNFIQFLYFILFPFWSFVVKSSSYSPHKYKIAPHPLSGVVFAAGKI